MYRAHAYILTRAYVYSRMHITRACLYTRAHVYILAHAHTHTHTRAHAHTHSLCLHVGGKLIPIMLDVTNEDHVREAVKQVDQFVGDSGLLALINNAAAIVMTPDLGKYTYT